MTPFTPTARPAPVTLLCLLLLFGANVARAQDAFDAAQRTALSQNPAGLTCTLTLPEGQTQFRQGELIPLTLSFTSDRPGAYRMSRWSFGPLEAFHVSPSEGVSDPRADEPKPTFFSYDGPPPPAPLPITDKPVTVPLTVNAFLRFDRPGAYRLYVTTSRVLDGTATAPNPFNPGKPLPTVSSVVSFTIMPADPAWAHAQAQGALAEVLSHFQGPITVPHPIEVLTYLGTPESARALLSVLATDTHPRSSESEGRWCRDGLLGYPDRPWLIGEMQRDLAAPDYPVIQPFLETLATLTARQQKAKDDGPIQRRLWTQAADAAPAKSPTALPMTLHTLLEIGWLTPLGNDAGVQARVPDLTRRMAAAFDRLPPLPQEYLLGDEWSRFRAPALLPSLRRLWAAAVRPQNEDFSRNDLILRRLYDLSPQEGRALILTEAARPRPRAAAAALGILPDRTLPALDKPLAANLTSRQADQDTTCQLIARYATPALFSTVRTFYGDAEGWDCAFQSGVLAYFLRVRPEYGATAVNKALAMRKQTGCYKYLFTEVAPLRYDANLENAAVAHLNDPDPQVVADAAEALGKYGSPKVEAALWARLRRTGDAAKARERFEWRVVEALATAQNWYESRARLRQIRALCATDNMRRQVDQYIGENTPSGVNVTYDALSDAGWWSVGHYNGRGRSAFLAKLAQFPRGAAFSWQDINVGQEAERLFTQTQTFAQAHGMTLTRWRPRSGG